MVAHSHFAFATPPLHFMFVVRRRNNFLGSRNNLKFAVHVSPGAACMLVITDAIMTTTIRSRIAIMIVVASD